MKISKANKLLDEVLEYVDSDRESQNIKSIFWEDLFNYNGGLDRVLHTREIAVFEQALEKLRIKMPIQYVTGISYFYDIKLKVNEHVLIPRPETEELVHLVLMENKRDEKINVLDIGTGSGCIPISIKKNRVNFVTTGIDKSEEALDVARSNAERLELNVDFRQIDFLDTLQRSQLGKFDIIISNPPYVSHSEQHLMSDSTLRYEPDMALYPEGNDELVFYKKISFYGKEALNNEGRIYLECNEYNAKEVLNIFQKAGFKNCRIEKDMQQKDRILVAYL